VERPGSQAPLPGEVGWIRVEVPHLEASSTDLRARVRDGRPLDYLVTAPVIAEISARALYQDLEAGLTEAAKAAGYTLIVTAGEFDVVTLFFSRYRSVISQIPTALQLIPAVIPAETPKAEAALGGAIYDYEPDEAEILAELLPLNIATQILRALLENAASEQGSRMSAMDNATRNAGDMIDRLTMKYNRSRQAMITKELIEIISGAEAL